MLDSFDEPLPRGAVIGTTAIIGGSRLGRDAEGLLSVDNGALRIAPPKLPGWGRHGIAYGPFAARPGIALAARVLNGHNNSQSNRDDRPAYRKAARLLKRLGYLVVASHKAPPRPPNHPDPQIQDNLAVGWYADESPADPVHDGAGFVVTAARGENAVLTVHCGGGRLPVVRGLQNLPVCYVILRREGSFAYYVASIEGANGCTGYPLMRPVAVDFAASESNLYAGVHQSVIGEGGFLIDSRVQRVRVEHVPTLESWFGTAHAADRLVGDGRLGGRAAEVGGSWSVEPNAISCTAAGATPMSRCIATLDPAVPSGLISAQLTVTGASEAGVVWRMGDPTRFWCVVVDETATRVFLVANREWTEVARGPGISDDRPHHLQILDDGGSIQLSLDGTSLLDEPIIDDRYGDATGVGLLATARAVGTHIRDFEAHPRAIRIPTELELGDLSAPRSGPVLVHDPFHGPHSELEGSRTDGGGGQQWGRLLGRGRFERTGSGEARVRASPSRPNPGRTAYGIDWVEGDYADLSADLILPGSERGENVTGRPGFIFFQDPGNYLIVNVWNADRYEGGAVSAFFRLGGRERLERSVWTNVGDRFTWGVPFRFRTVFDGMTLLAYLGDEPVLYRALTDVYPSARRLRIVKVGLVANWEYGDDMGSRFLNFEARGAGTGRISTPPSYLEADQATE